jgi:hypothetical protein
MYQQLTMLAVRSGRALNLTLTDDSGVCVAEYGTVEPMPIEYALQMLGYHAVEDLPCETFRADFVTAHVATTHGPVFDEQWTHHPAKAA